MVIDARGKVRGGGEGQDSTMALNLGVMGAEGESKRQDS